MKTIHKELRKRRLELGYSLEYVSLKLEVSSSTISRWEHGHTGMQVDAVIAYAQVLGWRESDLVAQLARKVPPSILKKISLKIYTIEGYNRLLLLLAEIGIDHIELDI